MFCRELNLSNDVLVFPAHDYRGNHHSTSDRWLAGFDVTDDRSFHLHITVTSPVVMTSSRG